MNEEVSETLQYAREELERNGAKSFTVIGSQPKAWVLLVDGQRVKVSSGKSIWKQQGHALNALRRSVSVPTCIGRYGTDSYKIIPHDERDLAKEEWINKHVEIITVEEFNERNKK